MKTQYQQIIITPEQAQDIASRLYDITGTATALPGEIDFNFRINTPEGEAFLLKIARPGENENYLDFQKQLLLQLQAENPGLAAPLVIEDKQGNMLPTFVDEQGNKRFVRLLTWLPGRLWSNVNPHSDSLRESLGNHLGNITAALQGFDHPKAHRSLHWDISQAGWTCDYVSLFSGKQLEIITYFQELFQQEYEEFEQLRKGVIHNDANDNNILVSDDLINPEVLAVIDFGDSVYTQLFNELAVACAYAIMHHPDPLDAALPLVRGFHKSFPLQEKELEHLYTAIAMRLVISVTKSAINKEEEPDNEYLQVSEAPAWELLEKWRAIHPDFAHYNFREACSYTAHPNEQKFKSWARDQQVDLTKLFPTVRADGVYPLDLSVSSSWIGHQQDFNNLDWFQFKIDQLQKEHPGSIPAGGYLEPRPLYTSGEYDKTGNYGRESRTIHLGIDFWLPAGTPVHALWDGEVVTAVNDEGDKEYGGLVILKHHKEGITFYTLHGHLTIAGATRHKPGDVIRAGEEIALLGNYPENGNWAPHLHFQLMLSMLHYEIDFPGVTYYRQLPVWKSICPDPNLLFKAKELEPLEDISDQELRHQRQQYLGKGMSLQYKKPIRMVRGAGVYLLDQYGRKYLDTVNNVAHVGHEHPGVVRAGQEQMALLNTNSRYLHENITVYAEALLATLPPELSVLHFVNSGSEANELALRMVKTATGHKDIIASEVGYHGNTNACVEISSYKFDGKGGSGAPEHTHIFPIPDTFRGKYRGADSGTAYAEEVKQIIDTLDKERRKPAAFIVEPIISCGGQVELPDGFLKQAYGHVRQAGGLCISDEVQVGLGRMGKSFWGFQLHDVVPDIVTMGKPLGNGHPLAVVACTREVADAFANGMEFFNTFGGNPVSCAIGAEVLKVVKREGLQKNALEVGEYLKTELHKLAGNHPIIGDVRGQGLFLGIELVTTDLRPLPEQATYLVNRMKEHGILMSIDGPGHNVIKIKPPMVFSENDADEVLFYMRKILGEDLMNKL
ncbi:aminotransferase class III-fold pyridoxal phosphate-dependent enzyme [Zeaxanthinibacter sp. PT1]|uniref:aminotransferase class III-fold pyridoxal phosphate-dependent enzyme n=1 Tax=Zeaxanthinibacter TaxID=561554 RepID=UPI00234BF7DD|nr:aminotransferase class III-fold pyridoxal phosphate-dependent enzyme [Zeaxanthinibacter sp. PT1]MDC6352364.1 aminotransferase class III-fold pyridoxal phosphate-dependent enzyme [Zeaxanthinibacter sp. PT1]